ncbi:MAG: hypothetical protein ACRC6F_00770 [Aeromonas sp.]
MLLLKTNKLLFLVCTLFCFIFISCSNQIKDEYSVTNFKNDLDMIEQKYESVNMAKSDFFPWIPVTPRMIKIENEEILIFEFRSSIKVNSQVKDISETADVIGNYKDIEWKSTPHFYYKEKIIVLYEGDTQSIINTLNKLLGSQFAGR